MSIIGKSVMAALAIVAAAISAGQSAAESKVHQLRLATPQPDPAQLQPGLAVSYAYPGGVRTLAEASAAAQDVEPGPALVGFDYPNTLPGENALTAKRSTMVVAKIDGYMRFDKAGEHVLEFYSNDGLQVALGGTRIYRHDYRQPCTTSGSETVNVPQPGWYEVSALFFQRYKTSCLLLQMQEPGGDLVWAPTDIYAHIPR